MKELRFKENLRELMRESGLTQQALASKIGVSQRAVSKWLRGEAEPTASNIFFLCTVFAVSADYLLGISDY